ncbi:MAG: hypothetical protein P1V97_07420 [Planctomycetota bacterium]|nr:hypothetical protein [Planctomycetota bacterium]
MNRISLEAEGRFLRLSGTSSHVARVTVALTPAEETNVVISCKGDPSFHGQGQIDDVSEVAYDDWKSGARVLKDISLQCSVNTPGELLSGAHRARSFFICWIFEFIGQ